LVLAGTFLYKGIDYSRLVLGLTGLYLLGGLFFLRLAIRSFYQYGVVHLWEPHTVLILGSGRMSHSIQRVLGRHLEFSLLQKSTRDPEELKGLLSSHSVQEVYVGEPDLDHTTLIAMSEVCDGVDIPFRIVPDILELRMGEVVLDDSLGLPTFQIKPVSLHGWTYVYKRVFDVTCSIVLVSLSILPLLFIAILIKLDSCGPILFGHRRMGHRHRDFHFLKFRTMIQDAENFLETLREKNERAGNAFKMKDDPRMTRIGKWLRKYSIDEIPQLLNVFRGDMSLVGPRPQVLGEAAACDEWARKRFNVLPGITGLWQVSGRAQLSYEEMIELDIYYIEHWSPGLDLMVLLRTLPSVLGGRGAY
jgi:exopolysaccharide biosynthesis polyprenyl glycosylphosphotransferase